MRFDKRIFGIIVVCLILAGLGVGLALQQRVARCAPVPLFTEDLLPNADLATPGDPPTMPAGWKAAAPGVQLGTFAVDNDERSLQLMGIANYIQTPDIAVKEGRSYCFSGLAITDSHAGSTARLRVVFRWLTSSGQPIAEQASPWQETVLWQPDNIPERWAPIRAAFRAPPDAATLQVRVQPSSDDRIYIDAMHVRRGGHPLPDNANDTFIQSVAAQSRADETALEVSPWPYDKHAALSFSFDWETAMGGLVHSRSVGDPYADQDPVERGLRMREGITNTLDLFRPYHIRATYYATGYNFLHGNTEGRTFMGNPTYDEWANTAHGWPSTHWQETPWFAPDPHGTVQSHPAWYFGDLVPRLRAERQDIQSHTFSHFYGGFVGPEDWRADIAAWHEVAAEQDVQPFRSLAFPWSSSGGMSEANWNVLTEQGVTSITRLSDQSQYNLFPLDEQGLVRRPHCRPVPGHDSIMACPDFYLTPASADDALAQIDRVLEQGGMIDLWAHTEEVVTPEQRAAWERVVHYATSHDDLWIAPLREIANWQHALHEVQVTRISQNERPGEPVEFRVTNPPPGLTLRLPFVSERVQLNAAHQQNASITSPTYTVHGDTITIDMVDGDDEVTIQAWPATSKD